VRIAIVERVTDGNALVAVRRDGTKLHLRLLGIAAPDVVRGRTPAHAYGEEARSYLARVVERKVVRVQDYGPDQDGRVLAVIWYGEINVNALMLAMGYAEVNRRVPCLAYCDEFLEAEAWARQKGIGVWSKGAEPGGRAESQRQTRPRKD
jgi:micrococcal nuclease